MDVRISPLDDLSSNTSPTVSVRSRVLPHASCNSLIFKDLKDHSEVSAIRAEDDCRILFPDPPSAYVDPSVSLCNVVHQALELVVCCFWLCPWSDLILTRVRAAESLRRDFVPRQNLDLET